MNPNENTNSSPTSPVRKSAKVNLFFFTYVPPAFFLIMAIVQIIFGATYTKGVNFTAYPNGQTVSGTITKDVSSHVARSTDCVATVTYVVGGTSYTFNTGNPRYDMCYSLGTKIPISYIPDNPAAGHALFNISNESSFDYILSGVFVLLSAGWLFGYKKLTHRSRIVK